MSLIHVFTLITRGFLTLYTFGTPKFMLICTKEGEPDMNPNAHMTTYNNEVHTSNKE